MIFFYNGKKPSKGYDVASGCLMVIAFSAMIYFFTRFDNLEDLKEYTFQLVFILLMAGSILYQVFRKKGKLHPYKIEIVNNYLHVNNLKIPIDNITLDKYTANNHFIRYHLWDTKGIFSIFSVAEDDLLKSFESEFPKKTNTYEELSSKHDGALVSVFSENINLKYDLDSGEFTKKKDGEIEFQTVPEFFIYEPKYKQGKALLKKK